MKNGFLKKFVVVLIAALTIVLLAACNNNNNAPVNTGCSHSIKESVAKAATCTESGQIQFWYCELCSTTYRDANCTIPAVASDLIVPAKGHTVVVDTAVAPTYTSEGLTEGSHCSVCNEVFNAQKPIAALQDGTYSVTYNMFGSDEYLKQQPIDNQNQNSYTTSTGLTLQNISVSGYNFKGWYTQATGGDKITEISVGSTGNKELFAQWEEIEYTINFDSPDVPVESKTYKVSTGATLENPSWFGYTFVGWSIDGKLVNSIPVGTTGNITLHANWTSERNKATAVQNLQDPSIIEDLDNGQYIFIYEIGSIQNVPLAVIQKLGNSQGIEFTTNTEYHQAVDSAFSSTMTDVVANATTTTSSWTLSEEWNASTSATNEHDEQIGKTDVVTDSQGNTTGGNYYISNSSGGVTSTSTNSGGSSSSSSKVTTSNSTGINGNYYAESEVNTSVDLNVNGSIGASWGPVKGEISAGVATNVNTHDKQTAELSNNRTENIGTYNENNKSSYWDNTKTSQSNWNTTDSYEASSSISNVSEVSNAISELIYDRYGYTSTENRGENQSSTLVNGTVSEETNEYSSTVEYSTEISTITGQSVTYKSEYTGYYRLVMAGTIHVFAVVGYDIATNSYYTYTYSVLDSERHVFLDYSKENPNFDDCENAVLPFEVPYFVHDYVSNVIARSDGLTIDRDTGYVTEYNLPEGVTNVNVLIPEYVSQDNGHGSYSAVRVRGIAEGAFRGNTGITGIYFPKYISEIPANAFEGCTNLETVIGYSINKIGENAFKDCTALGEFLVDDKVTDLGANAFVNAQSVRVNAADDKVARNAISSGAKRMVLDVSRLLSESDLGNENIQILESYDYFALLSDGRAYNNLSISSDAKETYLSNIAFANNTNTPLKIYSEILTLNRVNIDKAPGFALIIAPKSENKHTTVRLYGSVDISSTAADAVISKNVTLEKANQEVAGYLNIVGNYLVCGEIINSGMLSFKETEWHEKGELKTIDENTFESMTHDSTVTFALNGGAMNVEQVTVTYGQKYGNLPIPTRNNYEFAGWFTTDGTEIVADSIVSITGDHELRAYWVPKSFTVTFSANGGSVSTTAKTLIYGDAIGDLPAPTRNYYTFDGWYTSQNGGEKITAQTKFDVAQNVTVYAHWTPNQFTVTFNANGGSVSTSSKQVTYGTSYGTLPTPTRSNHTFLGWYTSASGGTKVTESTVQNNGNNITLYAQWKVNTYTLSFDANGGSVSTSSKTINAGATYGTLPTPTRDYYDFNGWYTAKSGGSKVSNFTVINGNTTVYAQWTLKPTQWTSASNTPSGAQIVNRKWTYTLTETTESTNSSLSGWTQTGSYWKETGRGSTNYASFPSGFDKTNTYYTSFAKEAYKAYDNGSTKREVSNSSAGYVYWHWMYDCNKASGHAERAIYNKKGTAPNGYGYKYFYAFTSTKSNYASDIYYCNSLGIRNYIIPEITAYSKCGGSTRWFRFEYYLSSYVDYQKIYTFQKITNGLESSTQVSNGGQISNVQELVEYRPK